MKGHRELKKKKKGILRLGREVKILGRTTLKTETTVANQSKIGQDFWGGEGHGHKKKKLGVSKGTKKEKREGVKLGKKSGRQGNTPPQQKDNQQPIPQKAKIPSSHASTFLGGGEKTYEEEWVRGRGGGCSRLVNINKEGNISNKKG